MEKRIPKNLLVCLLLAGACVIFAGGHAFAGMVQSIKIPAQLGTLKESYIDPSSSRERVIIQIQDAHCNYEAQKNLARILEYLIKEHNFSLVLVEGGSGDVGLSFLRSYSDKKTREEVAEKYLRTGNISGEEYLDIVSDLNFKIYGIEDKNLYDANLDSFIGLEGYREQGLKDLEKLYYTVEALKPLVYGPDLRAFDARHKEYEAKKLSLADYCRSLRAVAEAKGWNFKADYPALAAFLDRAEAEKTVDLKQAEEQRNALIKELARTLDEQAVKELIARTQDLKDRKISSNEYYSFLKTSAQQNRINLAQQYPQLSSYIIYASQGKEIKAGDFIKEAAAVQAKIEGSLFVSNDERTLSRISRTIELLTKFIKLDLTPEEYVEFKADKNSLKTSSWINFLLDSCRRFQLSERPEASRVIDDNFDKLDNFYKVGMEREQAFFRNIEARMREAGVGNAVVITGGFHTSGVSRMLKDRGYSYAVVTPAITKKGDSEVYFSVLRGQKDNFQDSVAVEEED